MKSPTNLILILLAIGLFYTFSSPVYEDVKVLSASASEYRSLIENTERMADTRDALLVNYQNIPRVHMERLNKILPDSIDAVRLALDLDTIGAQYGISISDLKVDTLPDPNSSLAVLPDANRAYQSATVTFTFISNYANFVKMLADLEKSLRIMDIKSISFSPEDVAIYEHTVKVETYWLK